MYDENGRELPYDVVYEYQVNDSATVGPDRDSGWSPTPPSVGEDEYLWQKITHKYVNSEDVVEIIRMTGDSGIDGSSGDTI
jgi:hypothetical protein